jgi:hypothetical protein
MRRIILSSVACPSVPRFSALSYKRYDFLKNVMCILISCTNLSKKITFVILRRTEPDIIMDAHWSSCKVPANL